MKFKKYIFFVFAAFLLTQLQSNILQAADETALLPKVLKSDQEEIIKDTPSHVGIGLGEWDSVEFAADGKTLLGVFKPRGEYSKYNDVVALLIDPNDLLNFKEVQMPHSNMQLQDIYGYGFSADSKLLSLGSAFTTAIKGLQFFDVKTGEQLFDIKLDKKNATYSAFSFSQSGKLFFVDEAVNSGPKYYFNELIYKISADEKSAENLGLVNKAGQGLTFSLDEKRAYLTLTDGKWIILDLESNRSEQIKMELDGPLAVIKGKDGNILICFVLNQNSDELLVSAFNENSLNPKSALYNLSLKGVKYGFGSSGKAILLRDHKSNHWIFVSKTAKTDDGKTILSVQVFNAEDGKETKTLKIPLSPTVGSRYQYETKVATFENTPFFAVAQEEQGIFEVWNYLKGEKVAELEYGKTSSDAKEMKRIARSTSANALFLGAITYSRKELSKLLVWDLSGLKSKME
ncbi:MAG: hypothetical protein HY072_03755 [Deltaproteobacteria bacterium]|nr:hypothetical protein [Deltaproteobacteria bacterium]